MGLSLPNALRIWSGVCHLKSLFTGRIPSSITVVLGSPHPPHTACLMCVSSLTSRYTQRQLYSSSSRQLQRQKVTHELVTHLRVVS